MEIFLKHTLPQDGSSQPDDQLTSLLEDSDQPEFDLTASSKLKLSELMKQRIMGRFRDDSHGFEEALKKVVDSLEFDESKPLERSSAYDSLVGVATQNAFQEAFQEIYGDREILR